jgi:hypothetical protein
MKFLPVLVLAILLPNVSKAETFNYSCKVCAYPSVPSNGSAGCEVDDKAHPLKIDDKKNVLDWRGRKYALTESSADQDNGCAKYGWQAKGNGVEFKFCTATQGYGAIEDKDGVVRVQCQIKR